MFYTDTMNAPQTDRALEQWSHQLLPWKPASSGEVWAPPGSSLTQQSQDLNVITICLNSKFSKQCSHGANHFETKQSLSCVAGLVIAEILHVSWITL